MTNSTGSLFTISAPSGAGKTSLVTALTESTNDICVSISHTTRAMRPGEQNGVNYHFVDTDKFLDMVGNGEFLEHAKVFTNYYGTSQKWVEDTLSRGTDVILEIDWQGAAQVRKVIPHTVSLFILPPSTEILETRLSGRAQDSQAIIDARMDEAKNEISHYVEADYLIINDDFDKALVEIQSIVIAERAKLNKQRIKHEQLLTSLLS